MPAIRHADIPVEPFRGGSTYQTVVGNAEGTTPVFIGIQTAPPGYKTALHSHPYMEIITVLESLNRLRGSPDYELCQLSEKKPGLLDELAAERAKLLEKESAELATQAERLAEEIKELGGEEFSRIG